MTNLFSIIIPTFNRADTLPETLNSVIEQAAENWEIIIIDDGSTDSTRKDLEIYLRDERIKYFFQENSGVSVARNKGVELSRGGHLIFLDSDDKLLPQLISRLNEIKCENYDLICWQVLKNINGKYEIWKPKKLEKIYNNITAIFLAGSVCYKKEIFLHAGGFDPKMTFGENYELGMRISQVKNINILIFKTPLSQYNLPQDRTSNSVTNKLNSYLYLYSKHKELYIRDSKSHSGINYLLGYIHEYTGQVELAKAYYLKASELYIWNFKAHLKNLYFNLFK